MTERPRLTRADFYDRAEAAAVLGVHPNTIDRMGRGKDATLQRYHVKGVRGVLYLRADVEGAFQQLTHTEDAS